MASAYKVLSGGANTDWTVPTGVTQIYIMLWGAPGGAETNKQASVGFVAGYLAVTPGDVYHLYAGGIGAIAPSAGRGGGFNGGGNGGYISSLGQAAAGGGGATDVRFGGTALSNRIMVAGGGGGEGGLSNLNYTSNANPTTPDPPYATGSVYYTAGDAFSGIGGFGGSPASNGANAGTSNGGGAATQTGGGTAGTNDAGVTGGWGTPTAGALGVGGDGPSSPGTTNAAGGGGGGGYYGGGGGGAGTSRGGGGGGGTNFISGSFTSTVNEPHTNAADSVAYFQTLYNNGGILLADFNTIKSALNSDNGVIVINYDLPPNAPTITSPINNAYFDSTQTLEIDWTFSSPVSGQTQSGFDIQYEDTGGGGWTTINQRTNTNQKYVFAANTFIAGHQYNIQVRTYDTNGSQGPWATIQVNALSAPPPGAPTMTAPTENQQFTASPFNVTWTIDAGKTEVAYRLTIKDSAGVPLLDTIAPSTRKNLCINPSFETDTTGWSPNTGTPTLASSTSFAKIGTHSGQVTWAAGSGGNQSVITSFATVPGQKYWLSAWLAFGASGDPTSLTAQVQDSSGTITTAGVTLVTAGTFVKVAIQITARSTVTQLVIIPNGTVTASTHTYIDEVLFELNYSNADRTYFDGANANGNPGTPSWTGTANDSTSLLTIANVLSSSVTWSFPSEPATATLSYTDTDAPGIWSATTTHDFTVNFSPPAAPTVVVTEDDTTATITLAITNDANTATNDVYRTDVTHGLAEIRIATGLARNATFVDRTPATNTLYTYRVRAFSTSGGYADAG